MSLLTNLLYYHTTAGPLSWFGRIVVVKTTHRMLKKIGHAIQKTGQSVQ